MFSFTTRGTGDESLMEVVHRRRRPLRRGALALVGLLAVLATIFGPASTAQAALTVTVINTDGDGVASRSAPQLSAVNGYGAPANATVVANCWTWGDSVGPYNNRLWWSITYQGRTFYAADRYLSTPNIANQPPAGQPQCGQPAPPPPPPPPPAGGSSSTPVWIGAPYAGYWPGSPLPNDARPGTHLPVFGGDWAMDYYQVAGTAVRVYVAPKDGAVGGAITTKVISLGPTCAPGHGSAGYNVKVGVYDRGTQVGWVSYAHVQPVAGLANGSSVNRWGGQIGTVGAYSYSQCYQVNNASGQHVHFEAYNQKNYSCYRSLSNHASIKATEYMGYLGGAFGRGACPAGA